jgi:hypothetical protein
MLLSGIWPDKCDQSLVLDGVPDRSTDGDIVPSRHVFLLPLRINLMLVGTRKGRGTIKHLSLTNQRCTFLCCQVDAMCTCPFIWATTRESLNPVVPVLL